MQSREIQVFPKKNPCKIKGLQGAKTEFSGISGISQAQGYTKMSSTLGRQPHKYLEILRVLFEETAELRSLALQCEPAGFDEVHPLVHCLVATVSESLDELGFGVRKDTAMWVLLDWAMDPSHCGVYIDSIRVNFCNFDEVANYIELHGWE